METTLVKHHFGNVFFPDLRQASVRPAQLNFDGICKLLNGASKHSDKQDMILLSALAEHISRAPQFTSAEIQRVFNAMDWRSFSPEADAVLDALARHITGVAYFDAQAIDYALQCMTSMDFSPGVTTILSALVPHICNIEQFESGLFAYLFLGLAELSLVDKDKAAALQTVLVSHLHQVDLDQNDIDLIRIMLPHLDSSFSQAINAGLNQGINILSNG